MTTDHELLERAAKAAGLVIDKSPYNGGGSGNTGFDILGNAMLDWHNGVKWNPLTDDGDAFRLAAKLEMEIRQGERRKCVYVGVLPGAYLHEEAVAHHNGDRAAATRRAIVTAAASLAGP